MKTLWQRLAHLLSYYYLVLLINLKTIIMNTLLIALNDDGTLSVSSCQGDVPIVYGCDGVTAEFVHRTLAYFLCSPLNAVKTAFEEIAVKDVSLIVFDCINETFETRAV